MLHFRVSLSLPRTWQIAGLEFTRPGWVEYWSDRLLRYSNSFLGAVEGSTLATERIWDSAEAPAARDLVGALKQSEVIFYFNDAARARVFMAEILSDLPEGVFPRFKSEPTKDWNQNWKIQFQGVRLSPDWNILPDWRGSENLKPSSLIPLYINPGMGFGSGEHETTALCLSALGRFKTLKNCRVLDFGTGSGILAIGAALKGAQVDAVEIDPEACSNAKECFKLNRVDSEIRLARRLEDLGTPQKYDIVLANILSPILIKFADPLMERLSNKGVLILSGLLRDHVDEIIEVYSSRFQADPIVSIEYQGEWAAVHFRKSCALPRPTRSYGSERAKSKSNPRDLESEIHPSS